MPFNANTASPTFRHSSSRSRQTTLGDLAVTVAFQLARTLRARHAELAVAIVTARRPQNRRRPATTAGVYLIGLVLWSRLQQTIPARVSRQTSSARGNQSNKAAHISHLGITALWRHARARPGLSRRPVGRTTSTISASRSPTSSSACWEIGDGRLPSIRTLAETHAVRLLLPDLRQVVGNSRRSRRLATRTATLLNWSRAVTPPGRGVIVDRIIGHLPTWRVSDGTCDDGAASSVFSSGREAFRI